MNNFSKNHTPDINAAQQNDHSETTSVNSKSISTHNVRSTIGGTSDGGFIRSNFSVSNRRLSAGNYLPSPEVSPSPSSPQGNNNKKKDPLAVARQRARQQAIAEQNQTRPAWAKVDDQGVPSWKKKLLEQKKHDGNPENDPAIPAWKRSLYEKKRKEKEKQEAAALEAAGAPKAEEETTALAGAPKEEAERTALSGAPEEEEEATALSGTPKEEATVDTTPPESDSKSGAGESHENDIDDNHSHGSVGLKLNLPEPNYGAVAMMGGGDASMSSFTVTTDGGGDVLEFHKDEMILTPPRRTEQSSVDSRQSTSGERSSSTRDIEVKPSAARYFSDSEESDSSFSGAVNKVLRVGPEEAKEDETPSRMGSTNPKVRPHANSDGDDGLLVLLSFQPCDREVMANQQTVRTVLADIQLDHEILDGADPANRERRNELFEISGLRAKYPQFFLKNGGSLEFWGGWDEFQMANDNGTILEELGATIRGHQPHHHSKNDGDDSSDIQGSEQRHDVSRNSRELSDHSPEDNGHVDDSLLEVKSETEEDDELSMDTSIELSYGGDDSNRTDRASVGKTESLSTHSNAQQIGNRTPKHSNKPLVQNGIPASLFANIRPSTPPLMGEIATSNVAPKSPYNSAPKSPSNSGRPKLSRTLTPPSNDLLSSNKIKVSSPKNRRRASIAGGVPTSPILSTRRASLAGGAPASPSKSKRSNRRASLTGGIPPSPSLQGKRRKSLAELPPSPTGQKKELVSIPSKSMRSRRSLVETGAPLSPTGEPKGTAGVRRKSMGVEGKRNKAIASPDQKRKPTAAAGALGSPKKTSASSGKKAPATPVTPGKASVKKGATASPGKSKASAKTSTKGKGSSSPKPSPTKTPPSPKGTKGKVSATKPNIKATASRAAAPDSPTKSPKKKPAEAAQAPADSKKGVMGKLFRNSTSVKT